MKFKRFIIMVADSAGIGEMPDSAQWGDEGSNTIANTIAATGIYLPNLHRLGLGNITNVPLHPPMDNPEGCFGKAAIASKGKDTTVGHWEMMGILTPKPFPTYPGGFPPEVIEPFKKAIGRNILGNYPASGTVIIEQLGKEHIRTGFPIVYTSADSVFQIAAHEDVIPVDRLYHMCKIARKILTGQHEVARVIARPFIGKPGSFVRTPRRKDFAVTPPEPNLLSLLDEKGLKVITVGKIASIFAWRHTGIELKTKGNAEGIKKTTDLIRSGEGDFIFVNLVDFDMLYGHRNNPEGYANALKDLDDAIPDLSEALKKEDCLILTADHGCDPTTPSTDHSREYVPILVWGPEVQKAVDLGTRRSLADMGQTVADNFSIKIPIGESFLDTIK